MTAVMTVMHEEMHERAGENEEIRQHAEDVGRMLGQQEEGGYNKKPAKHDPKRGSPPRRIRLLVHLVVLP
jgi:hypothetical protein